ncbi:MAG: AMP-dependent synthetase/ligase [Candidatus Pollutiaquabacter aromativorans]
MEIKRLFDIPRRQLDRFPKEDALTAKENGKWTPYSTRYFVDMIDRVSYGLLASGIDKGDKIAIISANRPEWNFVDHGMMQVAAVNVPIYTTLSEPEIKFILNDCGAKMVFAGDADLYRKIAAIRNEVPTLKQVYTFSPVTGADHWTELVKLGDQHTDASRLESVRASIGSGDLATILYTSGTTGTPKGVMLSHANIISNVEATEHLPPVDHRHRALSFLPLCHSYERMLTYLYMYLGVSIYYAESMDKIADNLKEVKPDVFSTVPRLLEKVYDRILAKGKEAPAVKRALFFWALNLGLRFEFGGKNGTWYESQLSLARKLVFSKWREALGGNVKAIVSGGAALQPRLARVFWAAGIPVLEGYGLTETSPVIAVNNFEPDGAAIGTVGPVIFNCEVKFAEDGEILCKGPNVMLGYYNRPDLTAEVIDADGWFHTGDIGMMQDGKHLKITDRKKEIFKTSGGKYIAPQALENKFKESQFIEQIMVIGENRNFPSALIVPAFAHLQKWCELHEIPWTDPATMIRNPQVIDRLGKEVAELNASFAQYEQVKKFELLAKEWTMDSGELTATLKLRRKIIAEKYKEQIERIYSVA